MLLFWNPNLASLFTASHYHAHSELSAFALRVWIHITVTDKKRVTLTVEVMVYHKYTHWQKWHCNILKNWWFFIIFVIHSAWSAINNLLLFFFFHFVCPWSRYSCSSFGHFLMFCIFPIYSFFIFIQHEFVWFIPTKGWGSQRDMFTFNISLCLSPLCIYQLHRKPSRPGEHNGNWSRLLQRTEESVSITFLTTLISYSKC